MMMPSSSFVPFACLFAPSDEEIIKHYLLKTITGEPTGPFTIPMADVYGCDPCTLDWSDKHMKGFLHPNELYFFVHRDKVSEKPTVKQPRRTLKQTGRTGELGGYWKSNTGFQNIMEQGQRAGESETMIIGTKKTLTFFRGRKRKEAKKTDYIMHEYLLYSEDHDQGAQAQHYFQRIALCRIKFNGKKNTTNLPPFGNIGLIIHEEEEEEEEECHDEFASSLEDYLLQSEEYSDEVVHDHQQISTDHDHHPPPAADLTAFLDAQDDALSLDDLDLSHYVDVLEAMLSSSTE